MVSSNSYLKKVLRIFREDNSNSKKHDIESAITVSRATSAVVFLYERLRSAMEYQEEHLVRRWAIERMLRRLLTIRTPLAELPLLLARELVWSHYIDSLEITQEDIKKIATIVTKYAQVVTIAKKHRKYPNPSLSSDWIVSLMSVEIDRILYSPRKIDTYLEFTYHWFSQHIKIDWDNDDEKELLLYIAIQRSLVKADIPHLRYQLLKLYYPKWEDNTPEMTDRVGRNFHVLTATIDMLIKHPQNDKLLNLIKRRISPFIILYSFLERNTDKAEELLENPLKFEHAVKTIVDQKYGEIRNKLTRGITRSIIYIFLTKMVIALLVEIPYDNFVAGAVNYLPLATNLLFPPVLMYLVSLFIKKPDEGNTLLMLKHLKEIAYPETEDATVETIRLKKHRFGKVLYTIVTLIYLGTFVVSFGLIFMTLERLSFNLASEGVFLFFLCVVSFFAYRISLSAHELIVEEGREHLYAPLIDFIALPILWVGRWLSKGFSRLNFMIIIMDFLIETPLKTFVGVGEEWQSFVKDKKRELA